MIAKGIPHANGARLARYMITGKQFERAELWQLRGFAAADIVDAFRSVHVMAKGTKCENAFFHLIVRNAAGETLNRAQWEYAANRIERILGLNDQPRAIAFHIDELTGHEHMHAAWSRIDVTTLTAKPLPFFKTRLKKISRELEAHLDLTPVRNERPSSIEYAPTRAEEQQARRLGVDVHDARETIRNCFETSDCGRSFQSALTRHGMCIARGERRDFLVIDRDGGMHALGKRLLGLSAAEIRGRLADLPRDRLPSVEAARKAIRGQHGGRNGINELPFVASLPPEPKPSGEGAGHKELPETEHKIDSLRYTPELPGQVHDQQLNACHDTGTTTPEPHLVPVVPNNLLEPSAEANRDQQSSRLSQVFKRLFRTAAKALSERMPSPKPQIRRRRGETVGAFQLAARKLLRPISGVPGVSQAIDFLHDALVWLHLWDWNQNVEHSGVSEEPGGRDENHLSPRL